MPTQPPTETQRLARLRALGVLDTPPEQLFDSLARLAAQLCGTPIALLSLVDQDRQWFKANVGLEGTAQTPREAAFCAHTILEDGLLEVPDAQADRRFMANTLVQGEPHIRFYAGVPLDLGGGLHPGSLCVIDREPRSLTPAQRQGLTELARAAAQALLLREAAQDAARAAAVALQERERKFRELSDFSPVGVFHTDTQGHCTYTNARWQAIYGLSLAESLGDGWSRTLHAEDAAAVYAEWQVTALAGLPFDKAFRVRRPDGSVRHVRSRARRMPGPKGQDDGFVGIVEDVTDALAAQTQLRQTELLLERAGQLTGVGGWRLELGTNEVVWSAQTCRIHDLPPGHQPTLEEAAGFYLSDAQLTLGRLLQRAAEFGEAFDVELPLRTATGRHVWVRTLGSVEFEGGRPARLIGAFQDVTERLQLQKALAHSNQQLRQVYAQTPALLLWLDESGLVMGFSERVVQRLHCQAPALMGSRLLDWVEPASRLSLQREGLPALWAGEYLDRVPCTLVCADGSRMEALLSATVEREPQTGLRRALVALDDVTEAVLRTQELAHEQQLRVQIERHATSLNALLTERSEMLNVLAHEVRQPLNNASAALQSAAFTLASRGDLQASEPLRRAQRVLGHVMAGVDNTLAVAALLAEGQPATLSDTDLDTLVAIAVADMPEPERGRVRVERATAARTVTVDSGLMRLALRNLLANALSFAPTPGVVVVRLSDTPLGAGLCIDVVDGGPGIADEVLGRLFQHGARGPAHERRGSHGLGLYIVRRAMELQGGRALLLQTGPTGTAIRLELGEDAGEA